MGRKQCSSGSDHGEGKDHVEVLVVDKSPAPNARGVVRFAVGRSTVFMMPSPFGKYWCSDDQGNFIVYVPRLWYRMVTAVCAVIAWIVAVYVLMPFEKDTLQHWAALSCALIAIVSGVSAMLTDPGILPAVVPQRQPGTAFQQSADAGPTTTLSEIIQRTPIVPPTPQEILEKSLANIQENPLIRYRRGRDDAASACLWCNHSRPIDCRHCPTCDVCILDYDHHCDVTGFCIGHRNIRYFIFTEIFGGLSGMLLSCGICAPRLWRLYMAVGPYHYDTIVAAAIGIVSLSMGVACMGFCFVHMIGQWCGETTFSHLPPRSTMCDAICFAQQYWWGRSFPSLLGYFYEENLTKKERNPPRERPL